MSGDKCGVESNVFIAITKILQSLPDPAKITAPLPAVEKYIEDQLDPIATELETEAEYIAFTILSLLILIILFILIVLIMFVCYECGLLIYAPLFVIGLIILTLIVAALMLSRITSNIKNLIRTTLNEYGDYAISATESSLSRVFLQAICNYVDCVKK